ncbi:DNA/RNA helicase domain-containing protein [Luteitalea sp.]|uniref:DNA/RNA helicase domain-containing protein n=1 Tax=Luteitalea sp. TaxID=2004800 RepID=UPI0025BBD2EE|nr:DNA/RNA helicase domain-containing protein [Luteitalea sp.]
MGLSKQALLAIPRGWTNVKQQVRQRYLLNAYPVLLTRALQGTAIFIPPGDRRDPTRLPEFYDETFGYLRDVDVPVL